MAKTIQDILLQLVICEPKTLETGCWEWPGSRNNKGYGQCWLAKRWPTVHKLVYEHFVGPVPEGLELDHLCRNRICANFEHLEPVTHAENLRRGTSYWSTVTHCPKGHPYDEANTRIYQGRRFCRACNNAASQAYREKKRNRGK